MIRDVVLHMANELPMRADIESLPTAGDTTLVCTNLLTIERRKPLSVDHADSVFIIPLQFIRFIEIPRSAIAASGLGVSSASGVPRPAELPAGREERPAQGSEEAKPEDVLEHLEPDEELLRRIREA
ncbi:hypothetical protein BH23CHL8_BH23CHL8_21720 [soil metagenome]